MKKFCVSLLFFFIFTFQNVQSANAETFGNVHITSKSCNDNIFSTLVDAYFMTEKPFELFKLLGQNTGSFSSNGEWISDPLIEERVKNFVKKHAGNRDKFAVKAFEWKKDNDDFLKHHRSPQSKINQYTVYIQIDGEISQDTLTVFKNLTTKYPNPPFLHVSLNSVGGKVDAAMEIGRIIRKNYGFTQVGMQYGYKGNRGVGCFSACVLIYASGIAKYIDLNDNGNGQWYLVGIHQHFLPEGVVETLSVEDGIRYLKEVRKDILIYLDEMGVPQEFLSLSNSINQTSLHYMNGKELRLYFPFAVPEYSAILPVKRNQAATGMRWDRFYCSQQEMMFGPHDDL